jgi:hypothetical protein
MTPQQFEATARRCKDRGELEQLAKNALARSRPDFAELARDLADELFPVKVSKRKGATPSTVTFKGKTERFDTGKEGYVWLVDQFGLNHPNIYEEYQEFHTRRKTGGSRIAQRPQDLFPEGSKRAATTSNYSKIVRGWYVDTNLNHEGKFSLLLQLSYLARLEFQTDWDFQIQGSTEELAERQSAVVRAREILRELLAM